MHLRSVHESALNSVFFECGNATEICNEIMFNFFRGLPHNIVCCQSVKVTNVCNFYITRYLLLIHVYIV